MPVPANSAAAWGQSAMTAGRTSVSRQRPEGNATAPAARPGATRTRKPLTVAQILQRARWYHIPVITVAGTTYRCDPEWGWAIDFKE